MKLSVTADLLSLPRRERERLLRQHAMLSAALAVFAERGYEQATVDEVAARAEFGKGTLYNYFPGGKEAILTALFDQMFAGVKQVIREHFSTQNGQAALPREVFGGLVARLISHFAENRDTFLLLMKEAQRLMLSSESSEVQRLMAHRDGSIAEMVPYIERAIAAGTMKRYPPKAVAHMLMGNVHGYLMYAFSSDACGGSDHEIWPPVDEAADFITDVLFNGLLTRDHA